MKLKMLLVVALALLSTGAMAQTPPVSWATEGPKDSRAVSGAILAAGTVMADTGAIAEGGGWAVIAQCTGVSIVSSDGTTKGGVGVYTFEQYTSDGTVIKTQMFAHPAFGHDGLQSIPPIAISPGGGVRIRTAAPLLGVLSCSIWFYKF